MLLIDVITNDVSKAESGSEWRCGGCVAVNGDAEAVRWRRPRPHLMEQYLIDSIKAFSLSLSKADYGIE